MNFCKFLVSTQSSIASLVIFRISFGLLLAGDMFRYLYLGWVEADYSFSKFHFGYSWLFGPLPGMQVYFAGLAFLALMIALGLFYRIATICFTIAFYNVLFIDKANYLNHFYLIGLLSFLMVFIPAHRAFSLDVLRNPELKADTLPLAYLWLLKGQLAVVYFFAAFAKIKHDWLIRAEPMRHWLSEYTNWPLVGPLMDQFWFAITMSWAGMLLDLVIVPLAIWRRTRIYAIFVLMGFHVSNMFLFHIGVFPWMMIAATLLFLEPDYPHKFGRLWQKSKESFKVKRESWFIYGWLIYFGLQIILPLRHYAYPGDVNWNKVGSRFSWRMKLNRKHGHIGLIYQSSKTPHAMRVPLEQFLSRKQIRKMRVWPELSRDFAFKYRDLLRKQGHENIQIFAKSMISLNGREAKPLIKGDVNLLTTSANPLKADEWLTKLD